MKLVSVSSHLSRKLIERVESYNKALEIYFTDGHKLCIKNLSGDDGISLEHDLVLGCRLTEVRFFEPDYISIVSRGRFPWSNKTLYVRLGRYNDPKIAIEITKPGSGGLDELVDRIDLFASVESFAGFSGG